MSIEEMKQWLEDYLSREMPAGTVIGDPKWWASKIANVASQAIAEAEKQEPVAGVVVREGLPTLLRDSDIKPTDKRLYTHPQPKAEKQEPVAWISEKQLSGMHIDPRFNLVQWETTLTVSKTHDEQIPLYTHPQPKREPLVGTLLYLFQEWKEDHLSQRNYIDCVEGLKAAHGITKELK